MLNKPLISIIFPAKNEGVNVKNTLDSLYSVTVSYPFEVIIVDDGSDDDCCSFIHTYSKKDSITLVKTAGIGAANARNLGTEKASGEFFIFCDAHLQFENHWIDHLIEPLINGLTDAVSPGIASTDNPELIGYGQTLDSNLSIRWIQNQTQLCETAILPGGCLAVSRNVFYDVGGFEKGFIRWGYEDIELSIKLWLFGYRCHVQPTVKILHVFRNSHPYKVSMEHVYYNLLRMAYSHFNTDRIQKCRSLVRTRRVRRLEKQLLQSGVIQQREDYFKKRKYDEEWYFGKFNIDF